MGPLFKVSIQLRIRLLQTRSDRILHPREIDPGGLGHPVFRQGGLSFALQVVAVPPVDVSGASTITLRVGGVDDFVNDFADWIEPMLIRAK